MPMDRRITVVTLGDTFYGGYAGYYDHIETVHAPGGVTHMTLERAREEVHE